MKKRLGFIFLGILILLSVIYLLRYKRALVFEAMVPNSATEIIHVNLRQIEHHILVDVVSNPLSYIDFKSSRKEKDSLSFFDVISIPKNVFFYTNHADFKGAWFSSVLKIKDSEGLSEYLIREQFKKSITESITVYQKNRLALAIESEQLVMALNFDKKELFPAFQTIFKTSSFLFETSKLLEPIVKNESDICYASSTDDFLDANFKNGLFEVLGTLNFDLFLDSKQGDFSIKSQGFISTKINKNHKLFQTIIAEENSRKFNDFTKLSVDSIMSNWNGSFAFNLKSINSKTDTIVTYDYDDDFNKIEKVAVQELTVPSIDLSLDADTNLFDYLSKENAIQVIESDTVFTSMPLYKLYANSTATTLNISSQKDFSGISVKEKMIKLDAYFNIEKYMQKPLEFSFIPTKNSFLQLIKDASIQLSNKNELSIKVNLKNAKRNFIGQFIKP